MKAMPSIGRKLSRTFGPPEFWEDFRALVASRGKRAFFYYDELEQFFELCERHGLIDLHGTAQSPVYPAMIIGLLGYWRRYQAAVASGLPSLDFYEQECARGTRAM